MTLEKSAPMTEELTEVVEQPVWMNLNDPFFHKDLFECPERIAPGSMLQSYKPLYLATSPRHRARLGKRQPCATCFG